MSSDALVLKMRTRLFGRRNAKTNQSTCAESQKLLLGPAQKTQKYATMTTKQTDT